MDAERPAGIPLFAGLTKHDRQQVARWPEEVDVPGGSASWRRVGFRTSSS